MNVYNARLRGGPSHNELVVVQGDTLKVSWYDKKTHAIHPRPYDWTVAPDYKTGVYVRSNIQRKNGTWVYVWMG